MSTVQTNNTLPPWTRTEKFLFRIVALYFAVQIIPITPAFYKDLFSIQWSKNFYGDIFNLTHYTPQFISNGGFLNWGIALLIAAAGAVLWTFLARKDKADYNRLYYWLRVLLRYRLAVSLFAYGFIKYFPLQSPYPSLSNLNTAYGDFNRWKIFSLSLGIVPSYQAFLGGVEIVLGLLLLFRRTSSIAAFIVIVFTGNVFMSNIAYDGGEIVFSFYLLTIAFFILLYDLKRIVNLLILQQPTFPNRFKPVFDAEWLKYGRLAIKALFILFFVEIYAFQVRDAYRVDPFQYPHAKALSNLRGLYNVSEFAVNRDSIAYSRSDPQRWQDVVFETWNTISIKSNRPVIPDTTNIDRFSRNDNERVYEFQGSAGRHYYSYSADTVNRVLTLKNRNSNYKDDILVLNYTLPDNKSIVLSGIGPQHDSIYARLDRIDKKYLLEVVAKEGRRKSLKL